MKYSPEAEAIVFDIVPVCIGDYGKEGQGAESRDVQVSIPNSNFICLAFRLSGHASFLPLYVERRCTEKVHGIEHRMTLF